MCTINKMRIGKKSGNLLNDPRNLVNAEYCFIVIAPRFTLAQSGHT